MAAQAPTARAPTATADDADANGQQQPASAASNGHGDRGRGRDDIRHGGPGHAQGQGDRERRGGDDGTPRDSTSARRDDAAAAAAAARDDEDDGDDVEGAVWETASLFEEILDDVAALGTAASTAETCSADEARQLRQRLHAVGASQFVMENITSEKMTARKLCTAFNVRIPRFLDDAPDESFYQLLGLAINRELNKRPRLDAHRDLDDAARLLQGRRNIMVITGAGISTSLGIPDFRSKNTGFYSRLRQMGYDEPEQVFDIHNFDDDPRIFYQLAGDIVPDLKKWTPTHQFIRLLQDKDKLLTNYTQNIDNVEANAGIRKDKLIQCHGSWATATCRKCKFNVPGEDIFPAVRAMKPAASAASTTSLPRSRARSASAPPTVRAPARSAPATRTPSRTAPSTSPSRAS
jgi:NAD-dependent histone deacetylase SIR2